MDTWKDATAGIVQRFEVAAAIGGNATWNATGPKACAKIIKEMARIIDDEIISRNTTKDTTHADKCENIFVFGSNLAGRHGKGAAKFALENHGAIYGRGIGLQGNSYAIPTKDEHMKTLPLSDIEMYVRHFLIFAEDNPQMTFQLTPIGCGLAGYKPSQIAPMFKNAPDNVIMPEEFKL